jgi:hypothetical protein
MLKSTVLAICILLFFSCNKTSNSQQQPTDSTETLISCVISQPQDNNLFSQKFQYDNDGNLMVLDFISAGVSPNSTQDSGTITFTYDPSSKLITSYTEEGKKVGSASSDVVQHILIYDNQNRVIKDSITMLNGLVSPSLLSVFTYSDGSAVKIMGSESGEIDSMTIVNGNVTQQAFYQFLNTNTRPDYTENYVPNLNFVNPFYNEKTPSGVRTFLTLFWFNDWVSKNLSDWSPEKMTWIKDSNGNVVSGTGDGGTQITFGYK